MIKEILKKLDSIDKDKLTAEEHMDAIELILELDRLFSEKEIYVEEPKEPDTPPVDLPPDLPIDEDEEPKKKEEDMTIIELLESGMTPESVRLIRTKAEAVSAAKELGIKSSGTEKEVLERINNHINAS